MVRSLLRVCLCCWLVYKITAYCSCELCCGKWADGITALGTEARWGVVACDLPFETQVEIESLGTFVVEDRGPTGKHIDIWFPTHQQALEFGVRYLRVRILPYSREAS